MDDPELMLIRKRNPHPVNLVCQQLTDYSGFKNIVLIDDQIKQPQLFYNSCKTDTYPILFNYRSTGTELLSILSNFQSIDRLCFVFDGIYLRSPSPFLDNKQFFTKNDLVEKDENNYSDNLKLVLNICQKYNVKNIDYLACSSLTFLNWRKYYSLLQKKTGVVVGASDDETGNIKHGGDWILESTGQDVENIYFTAGISEYLYTLVGVSISGNTTILIRQSGSNIQYNVDSAGWTNITSWPVTIINSNAPTTTLSVQFTTNITLNAADQYFIAGSSNIIFEGNNTTFTIDTLTGYPGLIQNGTSVTTGYSSIIIQNLTINGTTSTLSNKGGWFGQQYFGAGASSNSASNCSSLGPIPSQGGGIFGYQTSNTTATRCNSTGLIDTNAGGIFGYFSYVCSSVNCFSLGQIGLYSGGIFGPYTLNCTSNYSYSLGNIGDYAGGIFGFGTNYTNDGFSFTPTQIIDQSGNPINVPTDPNDFVIITTSSASGSYSMGSLGSYSGGIYGYFAYKSDVTNSYSIGNGGSSSLPGGIFAPNYYDLGGIILPFSTLCSATNTYSTGSSLAGNGIFALIGASNTTTSSFSEGTGIWNNSNANTVLTNIGTGTPVVWIPIDLTATNIPYLLVSFNSNFYNGAYNASVIYGTGNYTALTISTNAPSYQIISADGIQNSGITISNSGSTLGQISSTYDKGTNTYTATLQIVSGTRLLTGPVYLYYGYNILSGYNSQTPFVLTVTSAPCFLKGTKILCLINNKKKYVPIEKIKIGTPIKTYKNGFKKLILKGSCFVGNDGFLNQIYVMKKKKNKNLTEDLYITGGHSILVNKLGKNEARLTLKLRKQFEMIDDKYLLLASLSKKFKPVTYAKPKKIYHLVLENSDPDGKYGIYTNGILSESLSYNWFHLGFFKQE